MNDSLTTRILWSVLALTVLGAGATASIWGLPALLLSLAAGALSLVIVLMWQSLQQMEADDEMGFEQAMSYAAPSAEEEQKRALLRTLKDLEYELSVGKISREDYDQVSADVREKAKRVIALSDDTMKERLEAAEKLVAAHAKQVKKTAPKDSGQPSPQGDQVNETENDVHSLQATDSSEPSAATDSDESSAATDEVDPKDPDADSTQTHGSKEERLK